jgi:hypothetical protein
MTSEAQKRPLTDRRKARAENSRRAQQEFWGTKFDAAQTPLELLEAGYLLLRTRVRQIERDALAASRRARTPQEVTAAGERSASVRQQITEVCGDAAAELERLANTIDTTRR